MPEKTFKYYAEPGEPLAVEWSPDAVFWYPVEHYDVAPAEGCMQATVDVESGWVRARYLMGNPARFDSASNHIAVPEPAWIGLLSGLLMLFLAWRVRRGR